MSTGNAIKRKYLEDSTKNTGKNMEKVDYEYVFGDQGPFRVMVELNDTQNGSLTINKLTLASTLRKLAIYKTHVTEIKNVGRNKLMVYLNNYQIANRLTTDSLLKGKNYKAYIPRHLISVTGVISGIPLDITADEVMNDIESEATVMQIYRLNRFVDGRPEPSMRMSVTFRASKLPQTVKIFCVSVRVKAFYRKANLCLNCLRYNHKTENCKGKRRCRICTRFHDREVDFEHCQQQEKCLYCRSNHQTTDQSCPERSRQNNIQAIMARTNLTAIEAVEQFPIQTQNYYEALSEAVQEPTPAESFAKVTAGNYRINPNITRRKAENNKAERNSKKLAEKVVIFKAAKPKDTGLTQDSTALFKKYKPNDSQTWKKELRSQQMHRQETSNCSKNLIEGNNSALDQTTPSSNKLEIDESHKVTEDFSDFVSSMIDEGRLNPHSMELNEIDDNIL